MSQIIRVNTMAMDRMIVDSHNAFERMFSDLFDYAEQNIPGCRNDRAAQKRRESAQRAEMARRRIVAETFRR